VVINRAFNPDLILLSAGFDGGGVDQGNVKLVDKMRPNGLDLDESDFAWLTTSILGVALLAFYSSCWLLLWSKS
jgi:acetoin utilization deacetylase AcuC-like enzyme